MNVTRLPNGITRLQGTIEDVERVKLAAALCDGYTLEELQRMSLTFKVQIDVLRARPHGMMQPEPFWHVVVSESSPIINRAIRNFDNAVEYAGKCLSNGYSGMEVVPLYRLAKEPQK